MKNIQIDLDFEELDKLPPEQYNELERQYLDYFTKLCNEADLDYCRKKGIDMEKTWKENPILIVKMRRAVNRRKEIIRARDNLMRFNKVLRWCVLGKQKGSGQ